MNEPSVLDYIKSLLDPRQKGKISIPESSVVEESEQVTGLHGIQTIYNQPAIDQHAGKRVGIPLLLGLAMLVGFLGQKMLEPPASQALLGTVLLCGSVALFVWAFFHGEWEMPVIPAVDTATQDLNFDLKNFLFSLCFALIATLLFMGGKFNILNVTLWLLSLVTFVKAFWIGLPDAGKLVSGIGEFFKREQWNINLSRKTILMVGLAGLVLFFRFYQLDKVPAEPFSDHAEKLLDVYDVTQGQYWVFFARNTGREFLQFYLTAILATVFNMGLTFMALKTGTVLIGLFALPFIYGIGKEMGGQKVGIVALVLAGTSYWLNTISRIGLRFPLYPAFTAPAIYFLIRGLRRQNRNDFILSGLFLGLGLHGYTPSRIAPLAILLGVLVYVLHQRSGELRGKAVTGFFILALASMLVFVPLLGYTIAHPEQVFERSLTRVADAEKPLEKPALQIFVQNNLNALTMFNFNDGTTWVHSIPERPALDIVTAVFFVFGVGLVLIRYLKKRDWLDIYLLLSILVLLLPSTLSLAFPGENPSLNRTGAAAIVVMVLAAQAMVSVSGAFTRIHRHVAMLVLVGMLSFSAVQNYDLVFHQFGDQFIRSAWNTSDMGNVIRDFVREGNDPDHAYVIPYPYWADTRLVGIQAGYPTKDYALQKDALGETRDVPGSKLFILNEQDAETLANLQRMYPQGRVQRFESPLEDRSFLIFRVDGIGQ